MPKIDTTITGTKDMFGESWAGHVSVAEDPFQMPLTTGAVLDRAAERESGKESRLKRVSSNIGRAARFLTGRSEKLYIPSTVLGDIDETLYETQMQPEQYRLEGLDNLSKAEWGDPGKDILMALQDEAIAENAARDAVRASKEDFAARDEKDIPLKLESDPKTKYLYDIANNDPQLAKEIGLDKFIQTVHINARRREAGQFQQVFMNDVDAMMATAKAAVAEKTAKVTTARAHDAAVWLRGPKVQEAHAKNTLFVRE